jgi:O-antigen ligase
VLQLVFANKTHALHQNKMPAFSRHFVAWKLTMPPSWTLFFALVSATLAPFSALTAMLLMPAAVGTAWRQHPFGRGMLPILMLIWLVFVPATLSWSLSTGLSLPQAAVLLCLPIGWLVGRALVSHEKHGIRLDYLLLGLLLILLFWGLLQGPNTVTQKPQGPFNDPNTYAALLNLLMLPFLTRYLATDLVTTSRWLRTGQLALLAAVAFVAFLVSSRGAALALVMVLPPLIWLARNQPNFLRKMTLLATVALVAYFAALSIGSGASVAQRLADTVQGGDPTRIMLMKSAWLMIEDHPWLGTGLGTFRLLYPQYRFAEEAGTGGGWVHNDYLQLWLEAGLPMFLLMLGLVLWVTWAVWRTLLHGRSGDSKNALLRMGYLAGIGAILLHALVNFLFFFSLVSLLVGLYLARVGEVEALPRGAESDIKPSTKNARAKRLAIGGYVFLLGYLLIGQVAVEGLLGEARSIQRTLWKWHIAYPRYEVAYWISVLAPFHPTPQQIMGLELASLSGEGGPMRDEALDRMEAGWQRAPCYLPYTNDALAVIQQGPLTETLRIRGQNIVTQNLSCNARHGLSYYHAGKLANSDIDAMMWLRAGLAASSFLGDRLLLATAILSRTTPEHEKNLTALAAKMAQTIQTMEANPSVHSDQTFWREAQYTLWHIAGARFLELVPPPVE